MTNGVAIETVPFTNLAKTTTPRPEKDLDSYALSVWQRGQPAPSISLHLDVPDGGDWMARGKAAGCRVLTPWQNMSFGGLDD